MEKIDLSESKEAIKPSLILLDGTKGAGKTTVGGLLEKRLNGSEYLSLDVERNKLEDISMDRTEQNKIAFENVLAEALRLLTSGNSVIVDCGLTPERVMSLESLAERTGVPVYKFLLKASYDTLLNRVRGRDASRGKGTDVPRFDEVYNIVHNKDFKGFTTINTDNVAPEAIAKQVIELIND